MKDFYNVIKEGIEIFYYLSSIGLLIGIIVGLKQLRLMKKDFEIKNQRASIEKSIEYLNLFATEFIPKVGDVTYDIRKRTEQLYKGPINPDFRFDDNCNENASYIKELLKISMDCDAVTVLNRFEYFSAAFVSGLADEELAFNPLGRLYCDYIEQLYVVMCYLRKDGDQNSFGYTVKLYKIWKGRLEKAELEKKRSKLDEEISKIQEERIRFIGSE
jgi:hypothetical protein